MTSSGYLQTTIGSNPPNFYLYAPGSGFGLAGNNGVHVFYLAAQTIPAGGFTTASLAGNYAVGTIYPAAYGPGSSIPYPQIFAGTANLTAGTLSFIQDSTYAPGLAGNVQVNQPSSDTYALDAIYGASTGRFIISKAGVPQLVGYVVSPAQAFLIQNQPGKDSLTIEADHQ